MSEKWIITAAWPYSNAVPHLGTMLQLLSGDVITRYHKIQKHDVIYVSGSDSHGTPIIVAAEAEGLTPKELSHKYHKIIVQSLNDWNIQFDNYTITYNPVHTKFVQEFYKKIYDNGYMNLKVSQQYYCESCSRYLPDRFVEGTCPKCGKIGARGDQCTNPDCEILLKPTELIEPYCATCKNQPVLKETEHFYFDLPAFSEQLTEMIKDNDNIPSFAKQKALSMIEEGLIERPITRDLDWGVPAEPIFGAKGKNKVLYVWSEAVVGYISAVKQWAEEKGSAALFDQYWHNLETKTVYCIGKDNLIFHIILFPALLMATKDEYPLPHAVATTNFIMFKEGPFSKSLGIGLWVDEAIDILAADYWRYYLIANRPEAKDSYFDWKEFERTINVELNDVIGNFIHRTTTFISRYFGGKVPKRGKLKKEEKELLRDIEKSIEEYTQAMNEFKLKDATNIALTLARKGNSYLSSTQPWHLVKNNKEYAATVLNLLAKVTEVLVVLLWPIIPNATQTVWMALGFNEDLVVYGLDGIDINNTLEEQNINEITPIFHKVKEKQLLKKLESYRKKNKEEKKLKKEKKTMSDKIAYEDFQKVQLKIATVKKAVPVEKSRNLMKIIVDLGEEERQIVAGIKQYYDVEDLVGKQIVVVANLEPAKLMGIKSDGMLLAADLDGEPIILHPDKKVPAGTKIK